MTRQVYCKIIGKLITSSAIELAQPFPAIAELSLHARQELMDLAVLEKCALNLLIAFETWGWLSDPQREQLATLREKQAFAKTVVACLPRQTMLLKGPALARHYPSWIERYSADIDVLVAQDGDIALLDARLRALGMRQRLASLWIADPGTELPLAGSVFFNLPDGDRRNVSVEVQIGGFPISWNGVIGHAKLAQHAGETLCEGTAAPTLDATGQMWLILADLAHKTTRPAATIRHVADMIYFLERVGDKVDWHTVRQRLNEYCASLGIVRLRSVAQAAGLLPRLEKAGFGRLGHNCPYWQRNPVTRAVGVYAGQAGERNRILYVFPRLLLYLYRTGTLRLRAFRRLHFILRLTDKWWATAWCARRGMRVMFSPICTANMTRDGYFRIDSHQLYINTLGIFHVSQHGLLSGAKREQIFKSLQRAMLGHGRNGDKS